jgi:hypothetical protein
MEVGIAQYLFHPEGREPSTEEAREALAIIDRQMNQLIALAVNYQQQHGYLPELARRTKVGDAKIELLLSREYPRKF